MTSVIFNNEKFLLTKYGKDIPVGTWFLYEGKVYVRTCLSVVCLENLQTYDLEQKFSEYYIISEVRISYK